MDIQKLRAHMRTHRNRLNPKKRQRDSQAIARHVCQMAAWKNAKKVALFNSFGSEVSTMPLIEAAWDEKKTVLLPICRPNFQLIFAVYEIDTPLVSTSLGVAEIDPLHIQPIANEQIDFCLVPGLIFDHFGGRVGYGAGYYDRFLPTLRADCFIIGCCFSEQILDKPLPLSATDVSLPHLVTERGILNF